MTNFPVIRQEKQPQTITLSIYHSISYVASFLIPMFFGKGHSFSLVLSSQGCIMLIAKSLGITDHIGMFLCNCDFKK